MFDRIAGRYDLLNRLMSFGLDQAWRRKLCRLVEAPEGARLLDLATGTADVALMLSRVWPSSSVVGSEKEEKQYNIGNRREWIY